MPARTRGMLREDSSATDRTSHHLNQSRTKTSRVKKEVESSNCTDDVKNPKKPVSDEKPNEQKVTGVARYFLMKAEPESRIENGTDVKFSIDDLATVGTEPWDGVRNAEASKTMRERMKLGDKAFFYHSNTKSPGIAGILTICREGYPDSSAWTKGHPYYDPKSAEEKPKWFRVDVAYERHMKRFISLRELRDGNFAELQSMQLLKRPQLSVQQVTPAEWDLVMRLEQQDPPKGSPNKKRKLKHGETADTSVKTEDGLDKQQSDKEVMEEIAFTHGA